MNLRLPVATLLAATRGSSSTTGSANSFSTVGEPFRDLVAEVDRWANRIARTRDNYVVHPGLRGNPDGEDLYWKTEAVYTLVVLRLLRECGLQKAALPNRDNSEPMRRLAGRLADQADRAGER